MTEDKNGESVRKRWFDFTNNVYPAKIMMFIGSRKDMCDTVMEGLLGPDNPMNEERAESIARSIRDSFNDDLKSINGECLSECDDSGSRAWVVRLDSFDGSVDDMVMLSHECLHAALSVLGYFGVREEPPFEALCYLHEAILKKFAMEAFRYAGMLARDKREAKEIAESTHDDGIELANLVNGWAELDYVVSRMGWDGGETDEKWDKAKQKMLDKADRMLKRRVSC